MISLLSLYLKLSYCFPLIKEKQHSNINAQKNPRDLILVPMKLKSIENSQSSQAFIVKIISLNFVTNVDSFSSCNIHSIVITITIKIMQKDIFQNSAKFFR